MSESNPVDSESPISRRERGKLAQRAYRKRHASKFHNFQAENTRLRDAIRAVSDAAVLRGRPAPELEAALADAREAAGLEPLDFAASSTPSSSVGETQTFNNNNNNNATAAAAFTPSVPVPFGVADPVALVNPGPISPALAVPPGSLAGLISWACTAYTTALWRLVHRGAPTATAPIEDFVAEHMLDSIRPVADQSYLASLARARLAQDRPPQQGHSPNTAAPRRPADIDALRERYRRLTCPSPPPPGGPVDKPALWRSPRGVEDHLRAQATPDEMARVEAVVRGCGADYDVLCLSRFVISLCGSFSCSPTGPVWHTMYVTMGTGLMLRRLRGEVVGDVNAPQPL